MTSVLRRHRWWVSGTVATVLSLALLAFLLSPKRYTASGAVWLDHRLGTSSNGRAVSATGDIAERDAEMRYLTSADIATRTVDRLGLSAVQGIGQPMSGSALPPADAHARATESLVESVRVKAAGASYAVVASYSASDPVIAAAVVNQLLDEYAASRHPDPALVQRPPQRGTDLDAAHDAMVRAAAAADAYRMGADTAISRHTEDLLRQRAVGLDALIASEEKANAAALAGRVAILARLRDQQTQLAAERAQLLQHYGPRHPDVIAINQRIADVERDIAAEPAVSRRLTRPRFAPQFASSVSIDDALRGDADEVSARLADMRRAADTAKVRYLSLLALERRSAPTIPERAGAYVIARAPVPSAADYPKLWMFLSGGIFIAILAGAGVALARERIAPGFRSKTAAERGLGVPVLAMVPEAKRRVGPAVPVDPIDLVLAGDESSFGAVFETLRMGLGLGGGPRRARSVAVSSAIAGEGKTTVSVSLARSAALAGLRVVLIDCDVRRPAASRALAPQTRYGLADVLNGSVSWEQALLQDPRSGAWFLASKADAPCIDAVGSAQMMTLVADLSREFDLVVLDTAPVLALAETRLAAAFCDCVLIVARWRTTPTRATQMALTNVKRAGAKVAGAALTRVDV